MSSTSETGHIKNVANFESIILFCSSYGTRYNPSKESLKIVNTQSLLGNAHATLADVNAMETAFNNATNSRMDAFKPLRTLATKIVNALDATDATPQTVANARTINKKMQGQRAEAKVKPVAAKDGAEVPASKTISVSQQSFDLQVSHLDSLVALLQAEPLYLPNETALQTPAVQAQLVALKACNKAVTVANANYGNARIARDKILYNPKTGLVDVAFDVKKYIISVYGASSPEYKQVEGLLFKTLG